ncbi:MAG: FeoA family protein [Xanthomonadales bacterium]|nr:FeoA family protein [Xanthomonadales bacterium]
MHLGNLKKGQTATISAIDTSDRAVQHLMVLGLVEGTQLEFAGAAFGGDPLEFRFNGIALSLRREQARKFQVTP